ncbi:helix-turn-helix transcriptional regulator [Streptomyces sp. NBC_01538]|uniref:helix-turn-helix transcriptional regulator n=1 Tax=Streptomyces sp. NBC_01538 TaxID=2903897 RepID=UPI00386B4AA7
MTSAPHPEHSREELCDAASVLYERALREGHVLSTDAGDAPCLVGLGLLQPAIDDLDRLEPVAPAVALHRLLRSVEDRIADGRRRQEQLTTVFEPLLRIADPQTPMGTPGISVLSDNDRINSAITAAMADAATELLAIQPRSSHVPPHPYHHALAFDRDQALLDRGGRIRTIYQHTLRHAPTLLARYERLKGDAEARTLDESTGRLLVIDRAVAFIPDHKNPKIALEVRLPTLVAQFVTSFERQWQQAIPLYPEAASRPSTNGVTPRQQAIAALLVEGHTDAVIANRLGMNIRTARVHIAKLATTLGSESRAQLGYLIGQSGILDQEQHQERVPAPEGP